MRTAHLFSGAGGGLLADLILGHEPVLAIEWEKSCCDSLRSRAAEGWFRQLHVHCGDVRAFDFAPWRGRVDCIAAGFPCQDISQAGPGTGITGPRSGLVSEVFRAIDVIRPGVVWLENSPRIRTRGRHVVIAELVARGYSWKDGTLAASDVGAGHARDRWWCIAANPDGMRQLQQERRIGEQWQWNCHGIKADADSLCCQSQAECRQSVWPGQKERNDATNSVETPADIMCQRLQVAVQRRGLRETEAASIQAAAGRTGAFDWSPPHLGICGMVDGLAIEMDGNSKGARIKAAGNGQVPLAAAAAWLILTGQFCQMLEEAP